MVIHLPVWKVEGIDTDIAPIIPWYNSIGREWEREWEIGWRGREG